MSPNYLLQFLSPNSRLPSDVTFEVLPSPTSIPVSIPAHKCFLATASTVFDKMFFQSGTARGSPSSGSEEVTIQVKNVRVEVFRMFLDHIYGKELAVEELSSMSSVFEMFQLVEQYDMVELKETLLSRMKSQTVRKENFLSIVNLVRQCDGHGEAKDALQLMLSSYLQVTLGSSLANLSTFMSEHSLDGQTMAYLMDLGIGVDEGEEGKLDVEALVPRVSPDSKKEIITEFLLFSKFPKDQMEKMVNIFIEAKDR